MAPRRAGRRVSNWRPLPISPGVSGSLAERNEPERRCPFDGLAGGIISQVQIEPADLRLRSLCRRPGEIQGDRMRLVGFGAAPRTAPIGEGTEALLAAFAEIGERSLAAAGERDQAPAGKVPALSLGEILGEIRADQIVAGAASASARRVAPIAISPAESTRTARRNEKLTFMASSSVRVAVSARHHATFRSDDSKHRPHARPPDPQRACGAARHRRAERDALKPSTPSRPPRVLSRRHDARRSATSPACSSAFRRLDLEVVYTVIENSHRGRPRPEPRLQALGDRRSPRDRATAQVRRRDRAARDEIVLAQDLVLRLQLDQSRLSPAQHRHRGCVRNRLPHRPMHRPCGQGRRRPRLLHELRARRLRRRDRSAARGGAPMLQGLLPDDRDRRRRQARRRCSIDFRVTGAEFLLIRAICT